MATVAVTADNVRIDSMDSAVNCTAIGGGAGMGDEPDIFYQGNGSVSRKVGTAQRGFYTVGASPTYDFTATRRKTLMFKVSIGNPNALDPQSTPGLALSIGSGTGDYYQYSAKLPEIYPLKGGFIIRPVDPNESTHRDSTTGTPALTACNYFAIEADFSATSKSENVVMDAVDYGSGLNLVGGDGGSTDGTFQDFVDYDEGTVGNRFGYVTTSEGILFVYGTLAFGITAGQTTTVSEFTDSNKIVVFPDGLFAVSFSGLLFDIGNASTSFSVKNNTFLGRGTETGIDTRPVLKLSGTAGSLILDGSVFDAFASFVLNSKVDFKNGKITNSGLVTASGANLTGTSISNATGAVALFLNVATDPNALTDGMSFASSGTGHAIELGSSTPSEITLNNHVYSGYAATDGSTGNETIYNNSGKAITINIVGGNTPTIRNGTSASTTLVIDPRTYTLSGITDSTAKVTIVNTAGAGTKLVDNETVGVDGTVSYSYTYSADINIDVLIRSLAYENIEFSDILKNSDKTTLISQVDDRVYDNP